MWAVVAVALHRIACDDALAAAGKTGDMCNSCGASDLDHVAGCTRGWCQYGGRTVLHMAASNNTRGAPHVWEVPRRCVRPPPHVTGVSGGCATGRGCTHADPIDEGSRVRYGGSVASHDTGVHSEMYVVPRAEASPQRGERNHPGVGDCVPRGECCCEGVLTWPMCSCFNTRGTFHV